MTTLNNSLSEALADIIKPIVEDALWRALNINPREGRRGASADKAFVNIKKAAEISGLGPSTIRLYIRRGQLRAQKVGRRVLIKRSDLEAFLESNPIPAIPDKF